MSRLRLASLLSLLVLACGGTDPASQQQAQQQTSTTTDPTQTTGTGTVGTGTTGTTTGTGTGTAGTGTGTTTPGGSLALITGAPATPGPATDPNPPPVGTSGSNRWQIGAQQGLYIVDPAKGEPTVQGFVVVTSGPVSSGNFIPPDDTVVTLNGVPLLRDPNLNGAYFRVDPAGPQPHVGSGGELVLTATGTIAGSLVSRSLVLPCPSDVDVTVTPGSPIHLSSPSDITLNVNVPVISNVFPQVTLYGYDPATRALAPSGGPKLLGPGPLEVDVTVTPTTAPAYLLDLRWPGHWVPDGESGAFCGLAKRWAFSK